MTSQHKRLSFEVHLNDTIELEELKYLIRRFSQFKGYTIILKFYGSPATRLEIPIPPPKHMRSIARSVKK